MDKASFIAEFEAGRSAWDALLASLGATHAELPNAEGKLSVKDLIAHVTWYEREMIGLIESRALAGSELWARPTNERNALIYEQNRMRPAAEIVTEAREAGARLRAAIAGLMEEDLCLAQRFANMPHDWLPWQVIAGNTYDHYPAHIASIQRRLANA
jgi:hypothetical protein